jgi:hypothetical protein
MEQVRARTYDFDSGDFVIRSKYLKDVFCGQNVKLCNFHLKFRPEVFGGLRWRALGIVSNMSLLIEKCHDLNKLCANIEINTGQSLGPVTNNMYKLVCGSFFVSVPMLQKSLLDSGIEYFRVNIWGVKLQFGVKHSMGNRLEPDAEMLTCLERMTSHCAKSIRNGKVMQSIDIGAEDRIFDPETGRGVAILFMAGSTPEAREYQINYLKGQLQTFGLFGLPVGGIRFRPKPGEYETFEHVSTSKTKLCHYMVYWPGKHEIVAKMRLKRTADFYINTVETMYIVKSNT